MEAIMMPSSTTPATGQARPQAGSRGYGLVLFASILLFMGGCFNMIQGIAAVAGSHVFVAHAHYVFANLTTWGWITAVLGALQLVAAAGVLAANQFFRWFAVAVIGLNVIDQMFFIPAYPLWALIIIAVGVVALYGLCAYGSRENITAV
jgi:hypothetical protein